MYSENLLEARGVKLLVREGTSDEKTFKEVIVRKSYERRDFRINKDERWLDLGGNVGAFTCLAASLGASVRTFEPDRANVLQIQKNLELNRLTAEVIQKAVVHDERKNELLNLWPGGQSWRNSIVRNKKGAQSTIVECVSFCESIKGIEAVKMDIEGSEILILESWPEKINLKKMVFEYSFDADSSCERFISILENLKRSFSTIIYPKQVHKVKEWNFFPPAIMVFCTR